MPDVRDRIEAIVVRGDVITLIHSRMGTTPDGKLSLVVALAEHVVRDGRIVQTDVWYDPDLARAPRDLPAQLESRLGA
jgi:hypothetical protein